MESELAATRDAARIQEGNNDSLRKINKRAAEEIARRNTVIEEQATELRKRHDEIEELKVQLSIATQPKKRSRKKSVAEDQADFIVQQEDGSILLGEFKLVPEASPLPKNPKKRTRKQVTPNVRNNRRRQGSDSRRRDSAS